MLSEPRDLRGVLADHGCDSGLHRRGMVRVQVGMAKEAPGASGPNCRHALLELIEGHRVQVLLGLGEYESYNQLDNHMDMLLGGVVTNESLYLRLVDGEAKK